MTTVKRVKRGAGWVVQFKRGQWFAVDRSTGRRVKAHGPEHAVGMARGNNERELCGAADMTAAGSWGKA